MCVRTAINSGLSILKDLFTDKLLESNGARLNIFSINSNSLIVPFNPPDFMIERTELSASSGCKLIKFK